MNACVHASLNPPPPFPLPVRQRSASLQVSLDLHAMVLVHTLKLLVEVCVFAVDEVDVFAFLVGAVPAEAVLLLPPVRGCVTKCIISGVGRGCERGGTHCRSKYRRVQSIVDVQRFNGRGSL